MNKPELKHPLKLSPGYNVDDAEMIAKIQKGMASGEPYHYFLHGKVGRGKTFLAQHIIRSYPNSFWYYPSPNPIIKIGMITIREYYREYLEFNKAKGYGAAADQRANDRLLLKSFLCLDDIGNEKPATKPAREYIGACIERRYDAIKSGTPVLTVRFDDDPKYPIERFELVERCFNAQVLRVPTTAVGERDRKKLHATLTGAFRSEGVYGQIEADSMAAVGEVVKFLRSHIGQRPAGGAGSVEA